jgi:hypothetical protein
MSNDLYHLVRDAFLFRFSFMGRPFELAVMFPRRDQNREFAGPGINNIRVTQADVCRSQTAGKFRAVQAYTAGTTQPGERTTLRVGKGIKGLPGIFIKLIPVGQWETATRFRVYVLR